MRAEGTQKSEAFLAVGILNLHFSSRQLGISSWVLFSNWVLLCYLL